MTEVFQCPRCPVKTPTHKKWLKHLQLYHENESNFSAICGLDGCPRQYSRVKSLKNHIRRHHHSNESSLEQELNPLTEDTNLDSTVECSASTVGDIVNQLTDSIQKQLALFYLKLQEKHIVQRAVQSAVINELELLFSHFHQTYQTLVATCLENVNIDINNPQLALLREPFLIEHCFSAVSSVYKLDKYCLETLSLIEPIEYTLGFDSHEKHTFQYIPLLDVLNLILRDSASQEQIFDYSQTDSDALTDFSDGAVFEESPFFNCGQPCLSLQLYNDEFEVLNPLGSKRTLHKVSAFYFSLGNLKPKFRSALKNIHLLILVRHRLIKQYGVAKVLEPLLSDVLKLQSEGVRVCYNDQEYFVKGTIATVCADNLSAHALAGFSCSFNSGRVCRYCLCHHKDIAAKTREEDCVLRAPAVHEYHLNCVATDPSAAAAYGVNGPCALSVLPHFEVTKAFPPDVMHDVLEGVVPLTLKLVIKALHKDKFVTITDLNNRLKDFGFGQNDKRNKPPLIPEKLSANGHVIGKATEKWTLFRLLTFVIGDKVPSTNKDWQLYLLLREITEILLAPTLGKSWVSYLGCLIAQFISDFKDLYPDAVTPKVHYLLHYPRLILEFGAPRSNWCMRYESKHLYFKKVAQVMNNFKNVCYSLAKRNQLRQCWEWNTSTQFETDTVPHTTTKINAEELPEHVLTYLRNLQTVLTDEDELWMTKALLVDTVRYCIGDFLIIDLLEGEQIPLFVQVLKILHFRSSWFLVAKIFATVAFSSHLHAYHVEETDDTVILKPGDEIDFHPLDCYQCSGNDYIALLHRPFKPLRR